MKLTRKKLISLYLDLEQRLGFQPTKKQWIEDSITPSDMPIRKLFGGWINMLKCINREPLRFCPTKNGFTRIGTRNKSRKRIIENGYIKVYEPNHPTSNLSGYCLEHRMIAWDNGLITDLSQIVHHKNTDKQCNELWNLESMINGDHTTLHHKGRCKPRNDSRKCSFNRCDTLTASKYGFCRKHYKLQWQRLKNGIISNIYESPELLEEIK